MIGKVIFIKGLRRVKILIIRSYPSYMTVKDSTYNIQEVGLAKALVRRGHVCDVVFWTDRQEEIVDIPVGQTGIVHVFYKRGKTGLKNSIFMNCDALFDQYDILQSAEYHQIQTWLLARNRPDKTVVYHGPYYSPFNKRYNLMCKVFDSVFLKQYIRQGTQFLVKSELAREFLMRKGIKAENVKTVGVGIDAQMLSRQAGECTYPLYQTMKNDDSRVKLLYIGRFETRRDIPFIVDIFKKVLEKNLDARLYMIGTGDAKYLKSTFAYMEDAGVRDKIIWQERMEQKYLSEVYKLADFFLLPTEYEIFGMVLLEAMYYGNVVLTTRNGGSSTLIQTGENGFVFADKNADLWAEKIIELEEDSITLSSIQQNAAKKIIEEFTWDDLTRKFESVYSKIKSRNGESPRTGL